MFSLLKLVCTISDACLPIPSSLSKYFAYLQSLLPALDRLQYLQSLLPTLDIDYNISNFTPNTRHRLQYFQSLLPTLGIDYKLSSPYSQH